MPMSDQTNSPAAALGSTGNGAPSVDVQLEKLRGDLEHLKTDSKSWIKTWGVYLGVLGALFAVPKGALDLRDQIWPRADTSVAIQEMTIYHSPGLTSEIVKFPLVVMNLGNLDDVLVNNGATLTVAGQSVELTPDVDYGLYDNSAKVGASIVVPKDGLRAFEVSLTFTPKTRPIVAVPGMHQVDINFLDVHEKPYKASFCFPMEASDVHTLFESSDIQTKTILKKQCGRPR
jgi:hypothetical protein